ncbi:MAG: gliding motility-associated ABC transporter permease subunit GldF [Saprospiraceae bacterium]|nr:gliding motility-associated ABC transporter permease subunit GldF [Saprospiraceae bacterium]
MFSIFLKEINSFFSSLIAYVVVGVFLLMIGMFMWVFSDTSVLEYNFAVMDQLFSIAPLVFLFLIPAITMRSFAEEKQKGTIEFLYTKPLTITDIVLGKYFAGLALVLFALLPTALYYFTIYQLGAPPGNLDSGAILGSYIGLFFLSASFVAIGLFASSLTNNQIVAFIAGAFLCFIVHWSFSYIAKMPVFTAKLDLLIQKIGINYHYSSISKGVVDSRDIIYFISVIAVFLISTHTVMDKRQ